MNETLFGCQPAIAVRKVEDGVRDIVCVAPRLNQSVEINGPVCIANCLKIPRNIYKQIIIDFLDILWWYARIIWTWNIITAGHFSHHTLHFKCATLEKGASPSVEGEITI